jgi:uncharacterized protein (TIGR00369 family)
MQDTTSLKSYPVLDFLLKFIKEEKTLNATQFIYPTAISKTLNFQILKVELQRAIVSIFADPQIHGNQQGTIHGGLICELADAAIGTAHSTCILSGQSFTTIELKVNFIRPNWRTQLKAEAYPIYSGKSMTHYKCEVTNEENKLVAFVTSTVLTLDGEKARGR